MLLHDGVPRISASDDRHRVRDRRRAPTGCVLDPRNPRADTVERMEIGSTLAVDRDHSAHDGVEAWHDYRLAAAALYDAARQLLHQLPSRDWITPDRLLQELTTPTSDLWLHIDTHADPGDVERFHERHWHMQRLARQHTRHPAEQVRHQIEFWGVNPGDFHLDPRGDPRHTATPPLSGALYDCGFVIWSDDDGVAVRIRTPETPIAQPPHLANDTRAATGEQRWQYAGYQLVWGVRQYHESAGCRHEHGGSERCLWCRVIPPRFLVVETA